MDDKAQTSVQIPAILAFRIHEYLLLLRRAVYANGDLRKQAIEELNLTGTPMVAFEEILQEFIDNEPPLWTKCFPFVVTESISPYSGVMKDGYYLDEDKK